MHTISDASTHLGDWLDPAGAALARAVVEVPRAGPGGLDGQVLADAAPAALLLARDAALRLAGLVGPGDRAEAEAFAALRLLGVLTDEAYAAQEHQLAQVLDWWWS